MRRWVWINGLSLVTFSLFVAFLIMQVVFGWRVYNDDLQQAGQATVGIWNYLATGHFGEALFENWESEFLQLGSYVLLTSYLVQRGSPESKPLDEVDRPDDMPDHATEGSPAWSKRPGIRQLVYRNSLAIALLGFFALSFLAHLFTGTAAYNQEQALESGASPVSVLTFFTTADFWFQSMQNWQSEFLAVGALITLSIVLRQHGSPESKPVTAPHRQTGS